MRPATVYFLWSSLLLTGLLCVWRPGRHEIVAFSLLAAYVAAMSGLVSSSRGKRNLIKTVLMTGAIGGGLVGFWDGCISRGNETMSKQLRTLTRDENLAGLEIMFGRAAVGLILSWWVNSAIGLPFDRARIRRERERAEQERIAAERRKQEWAARKEEQDDQERRRQERLCMLRQQQLDRALRDPHPVGILGVQRCYSCDLMMEHVGAERRLTEEGKIEAANGREKHLCQAEHFCGWRCPGCEEEHWCRVRDICEFVRGPANAPVCRYMHFPATMVYAGLGTWLCPSCGIGERDRA